MSARDEVVARERWGRKLVGLRESRGWSIRYAADRLGVSRHTLRRAELGESITDTSKLSIADGYAMPWHVLFDLNDLRRPALAVVGH